MKDGKCWSKSDVAAYVQWANASSYCSGVWHLPSQAEFNALIRAYFPQASANGTGYDFSGSTATFAADWGATSGHWWSSTERDSSRAYGLRLDSSSIYSDDNLGKTGYAQVRCVSDDTSNPKTYKITYDIGDTRCGNYDRYTSSQMPSPNPQTGTTTEDYVTLNSHIPTGDESSFRSWCTQKVPYNSACNSQSYQPGEDFPLTQSDTTITLYATWKDGGATHSSCLTI